MIRTIRAFFLSRLLREKVLLAGFIVLAAAVWVSSIAGRTGRTIRAVRATSGSLNEQQLWLSNRAMIEASGPGRRQPAGRRSAPSTRPASSRR